MLAFFSRSCFALFNLSSRPAILFLWNRKKILFTIDSSLIFTTTKLRKDAATCHRLQRNYASEKWRSIIPCRLQVKKTGMVENMLIWHVVVNARFRCVALVLVASHQNFVMSDHRKNFFRWLLSVLFCCWNSSNSFTENNGKSYAIWCFLFDELANRHMLYDGFMASPTPICPFDSVHLKWLAIIMYAYIIWALQRLSNVD